MKEKLDLKTLSIKPRKTEKELTIFYREGTTDEKVIPEVLKTNVYQSKKNDFYIESNDRWLDLGGNIGTFLLLCLAHQVQFVISFEPEPENFSILKKNVLENFPKEKKHFRLEKKAIGLKEGSFPLYLCKGDYNKYRHSMLPRKGRKSIQVKVDPIAEIIEKYKIDCIKMDIEGAEIEILEKIPLKVLKPIKKLVFEYSFDFDKSIPRFLKIIEKLRKHFKVVSYSKVKDHELEYNYFPPCVNVFCKKK